MCHRHTVNCWFVWLHYINVILHQANHDVSLTSCAHLNGLILPALVDSYHRLVIPFARVRVWQWFHIDFLVSFEAWHVTTNALINHQSPQCKSTFLLSPGVSESSFLVYRFRFWNETAVLVMKRAMHLCHVTSPLNEHTCWCTHPCLSRSNRTVSLQDQFLSCWLWEQHWVLEVMPMSFEGVSNVFWRYSNWGFPLWLHAIPHNLGCIATVDSSDILACESASLQVDFTRHPCVLKVIQAPQRCFSCFHR